MKFINKSSRVALLLCAGLVGMTLDGVRVYSQTADAFNPGANNAVYALAVQADGGIVAGGAFTNLAGQGRAHLGRLNAGGSLDSGFNPGAGGAEVLCLGIQEDGKILVGGTFTNLAGVARTNLGRLNVSGSIDSAFNSSAGSSVFCLSLQSDGKILVGGQFARLAGQSRTNLGRLNANGTLDGGFTASARGGANSNVNALALQPDGKILVAGTFTNLNGQSRSNLGRLNADGTLDTNFAASANTDVYALAVQADGKILVGGNFTNLNGFARSYLGRLNTNGTLDTNFIANANASVGNIAVQADGRILVGGAFTNLAGQQRKYLGRLLADGSLDSSFNPGSNGTNYFLALQADGALLVGGSFTNLAGQSRTNVGRLINTDSATQNVSFDGSTFTWLRGGTGPEVWRTSLEAATNATNWSSLGAGTRIAGGWQWSSVTLPANTISVRSRGFVSAQEFNGSSWLVETVVGALSFTAQPSSRTNVVTTTASFTVATAGTPSSYQWLKAGGPMTDGANVSGSQTPSLTLTNVQHTDEAGYSVVITNYFGAITSSIATLTVLDPSITNQPASRTNNAGTTASFTVGATGPPFAYQWFKDGAPMSDGGNVAGSLTATLTLTNVLHADQSGYFVVLSNSYAVLTSSVAALTIVDPFITTQPVDQIVNVGQLATFTLTAVGTSPLTFQWQFAGTNLPGATAALLTLSNVQPADAGAYRAVVSNQFGSVTSSIATLTVNQALTDSFNPAVDSRVNSVAVQPDGRIIAAGSFATLGGQPHTNIGRFSANGTLDSLFNPGASGGGGLYSVGVQTNGQILIGGWLDELGGQSRTNLGRVNADGTLDSAFHPTAFDDGSLVGYPLSEANLAQQSDGKILVWGMFTNLAGQARSRLGRLNSDGSLDAAFNPSVIGDGFAIVFAAAQQPDGKILVGGFFTDLAGQARSGIGRLNTSGTLDTSFTNANVNGYLTCLQPQPDGKILVGGVFTALGGQARTNIGRLNSDGTLDVAFSPNASGTPSGSSVWSLALQTDGAIIVAGSFTNLAGQKRVNLARLNSDGTLDATFAPFADSSVLGVAVQPDGKILVCGSFTTLAGQARSYLGRLNNTTPATQSLAYDGSTVSWLRGGSSPEVWRVTFESSTNGTAWSSLGNGIRSSGGWQLSSVSLPTNATIRARGHIWEGFGNGSSWFVEATVQASQQPPPPPPVILFDDGNFGVISNVFGFSISGTTGQVVVVETSTNLVNWVPLSTNTINPSPFYFSDPAWLNFSSRFYRARSQ